MARRTDEEETPAYRGPIATTPEGLEAQVGAAAYSLAHEQILSGVASSQVIVHFLKAASPREQLERDSLRSDNELKQARIEQIRSQARIEDLFVDAMNVIKGYRGEPMELVDDETAELQ